MTSTSELLTAMQGAVSEGVFPGAVLLVRLRGETVFEEAVGASILTPRRESATVDTIYDLASLTKPLATATAILCLAQEGRLALTDAIARYLPALRERPVGKATITDLLSHRAGLPGWRPLYQWFPGTQLAEARSDEGQDGLVERIGDEPLVHELGTQALYSDLGFMLLGRLVERVARARLDDFCRDRIYLPIGAMPLSYRPVSAEEPETARAAYAATEDDPWRGRMLRGEVHDENAAAMGGVAGHAGLFGTARAVAMVLEHWLCAWHGEPSLLNPALVRQFTSRQDPKDGSSWALGWDTPSQPSSSGRHFSAASFGHLGFTGTSVWVDPVVRLEVVLLSNRVHPTRANVRIQRFRPLIHDLIYQVAIGRNREVG